MYHRFVRKHLVRIRWGRVTSLEVFCDTATLAAVCRRQAEHGIPEAAAAPIES